MLLDRIDCSVPSGGAIANNARTFYGNSPRVGYPWTVSRLEIFCRGDTVITPDSVDTSAVMVEVFFGSSRVFSRFYTFDQALAFFNAKPVVDAEDLQGEIMTAGQQLRVELTKLKRMGFAGGFLETAVQIFGNRTRA